MKLTDKLVWMQELFHDDCEAWVCGLAFPALLRPQQECLSFSKVIIFSLVCVCVRPIKAIG